MSKTFIADIQPNQDIAAAFVVSEKQLRTTRSGTAFLTLRLVDRTGEITGRVWDNATELAAVIPLKGAVFLRGRSETYRDEVQLNIQEARPLKPEAVDPADFLPVCPKDRDVLFEKLSGRISEVEDRSCKQLLKAIFKDRVLLSRFKSAPAAKSMHHAYLGGSLEHTLSVVELVLRICRLYPFLDRDLLVAGAILHDIGKTDEYVYDLAIDYSHSGRLLGHMVLGVQIVDEKIRLLKDFPEEKAWLIKHMILSHHGEAEFGAAKLPMTREAFVLHHADDLDAKMNNLTRILSEPKAGNEVWTGYQPLFERFFYRGLPKEQADTLPLEGEETEDERGVQLNLWNPEKPRK